MNVEAPSLPTTANVAGPASTRERLLSLDVFRGLAVMAMMMVDWPGSWTARYALFDHARWNGITPPDFIFPAFMFIMGVALVFSLSSTRAAGAVPARVYLGICRRSLLLFLAGYFLNLCWQWDLGPLVFAKMRLLGVLQRFAIVYLIVAIAYLHLSLRHLLAAGVATLLAYWALMTMVPVPGFGPPDLNLYPEGEVAPNLATWLDKIVLGGMTHRYPHDPEGLLSTLPATVTALIGVAAGQWLRTTAPAETRANHLFAWGVLLVVVGYAWGLILPLNKNLWSSSFVVFMGGFDLLFLGSLFWLIDIRKQSRALALPRAFGVNALGAMVLFTFINAVMRRIPAGLTAQQTPRSLKAFLFDHLFRPWLSEKNASWVFSVVAILLLGLVFRSLDRRRWFLRV
jgi:predicted acyltransferase